MDQLQQGLKDLIDKINRIESQLISVEGITAEQEDKLRKQEFFSQVSFLFGSGSITSMEYKAIMDMMSSPDHENHYMAKTIVEKKIADSQYHIIAMNI